MKRPEPGGGSKHSGASSGVEVFELGEIGDLRACLGLQRAIWQGSETELVPISQLRAAQHAGGLLAGARLQGRLVGFCYGFPAHRPARHPGPGLHSHMTGVIAEARSRGVGRALKEFQRRWCLEREIRWVEWTFDPLRAANARFNLEHLGATAAEYLDDTYGELEDGLNAGVMSDRLMAHWALDRKAAGEVPGRAAPAVTGGPGGVPERIPTAPAEGAVSIAVPADFGALLAKSPVAARKWRLVVREAFHHYLNNGYEATRFLGGAYILERKSN